MKGERMQRTLYPTQRGDPYAFVERAPIVRALERVVERLVVQRAIVMLFVVWWGVGKGHRGRVRRAARVQSGLRSRSTASQETGTLLLGQCPFFSR